MYIGSCKLPGAVVYSVCVAKDQQATEGDPDEIQQAEQQVRQVLKTASLKGLCKEKKNPRLLWKWVGSRSHSDFFLVENLPKIALNQCYYFGVVYHVYSVCIYIAKSCWLL